MYYYFHKNTVVELPFEVNTDLNKGYEELTEVQRKYYLANPYATINEIREATSSRKTNATPTYYMPEFTEDSKEMYIQQAKENFSRDLGEISQLEFCLSLASLFADTIGIEAPYETKKAAATIKRLVEIYAEKKPAFESALKGIEDATSYEEAEAEVASYANVESKEDVETEGDKR